MIAQIDVKKIIKEKLYPGKKGLYLDLAIWLNDEPDQYGNDISIEQSTKKGEKKNYIGNGRYWKKDESPGGPSADQDPDKDDDLPF